MTEPASHQHEEDGAHAVQRLERRYKAIAAERMAGLPIMNLALDVRAAQVRAWQHQWITALVTPWFLNLVILPANPSAVHELGADTIKVGSKQVVALPGGNFEFIGSHDEELGAYAMCSLFSPVFEFADQETAAAAAEAALSAVMEDADPGPHDEDMMRIWRGEQHSSVANLNVDVTAANDETSAPEEPVPDVSRRGFLFGRPPRGDVA